MSVLDNLGINPGLLLIWIIAFIVLYTLLTRFIYDPLTNVLSERRNKIAKGLEDAAAAAREREIAEGVGNDIRAEARSDAQKLIDESRGRGETVAANIEREARAQASKILEDAQSEAVALRNAELGNLRDQVLNISVALASRILEQNISRGKQRALVDSFIADVPAEAQGLGGTVDIISAMPLTKAEQAKVSKRVGAEEARFSVDPAILGGIIVRWQGGMIDGSVRSQLDQMARSLN